MTINKVDTNGYWKVGNTAIYVPSYKTRVEHSNITGASTGRSEDGIMRIDWVRRDVRKVYLRYAAMTKTELSTLFNLMQGKEFKFTFRDKGATVQMDAYVGETSYEFYSYGGFMKDANNNAEEVYTNVEIHVIER